MLEMSSSTPTLVGYALRLPAEYKAAAEAVAQLVLWERTPEGILQTIGNPGSTNMALIYLMRHGIDELLSIVELSLAVERSDLEPARELVSWMITNPDRAPRAENMSTQFFDVDADGLVAMTRDEALHFLAIAEANVERVTKAKEALETARGLSLATIRSRPAKADKKRGKPDLDRTEVRRVVDVVGGHLRIVKSDRIEDLGIGDRSSSHQP